MQLPLNTFLWKEVFRALTRARAAPACWPRDAPSADQRLGPGAPRGSREHPPGRGALVPAPYLCADLRISPHAQHSGRAGSHMAPMALSTVCVIPGSRPCPRPAALLHPWGLHFPRPPAESSDAHELPERHAPAPALAVTLICGRRLHQTRRSKTWSELPRWVPQRPPRVTRFAAGTE